MAKKDNILGENIVLLVSNVEQSQKAKRGVQTVNQSHIRVVTGETLVCIMLLT